MRLALALVLALSACAGANRSPREAWDEALNKQAEPGDSATGDGKGGGAQKGRGAGDGWHAIAQFALDASERLAGGSTTVALARVAEQLCAELPAELDDDPAPDAVRCPPRVPLAALGHDFEIEVGEASTIALFAPGLSDPESAELVRQFLQRMRGVCREAWEPSPPSADNALEDFRTCRTNTGAVLVLGRFPTDLGAGQWQFSLAVLGPG